MNVIQTFKRLLLVGLCAAASQLPAVEELRTLRNGMLGPLVEAPDHQVFVNPLGFVIGTPTLGYEQALSSKNSFTVGVGARTWGDTSYAITQVGLLGSYRWYLGDHAKMQGIYVGPLAAVHLVSAAYDVGAPSRREYTSSSLIGVGAEGGYQWIFPFHMTLGVGLNAAYYAGSLSLASGAPSIPFGGVGVGLSGAIGYAF